jgi:hypothetical protein
MEVNCELVNPLNLAQTWARAAGKTASDTNAFTRDVSRLNITSFTREQGKEYRQNLQKNNTGQQQMMNINGRGDGDMVNHGCGGPLSLAKNGGSLGNSPAGSSSTPHTSGGGGTKYMLPN